MAKNKSESIEKPHRLKRAGGSQRPTPPSKKLSSSDVTQQQNSTTQSKQGMPRPGYKRKGIVLPDVMIRDLKHRAVDLGITDSELVERAVRAFLDSDHG